MATAGVRRAVAIGGGTGLPPVLAGLVEEGFDVTAVVTMADDGGSSGTLRRELGILPPGDIRNCLVALAGPGSDLAAVFQYRFPHGEGLAGHALGNLIIAALVDIEGGFSQAIDAAGRMLGARGRVVPSTLHDVGLVAVDSAGRPVSGQARIANTRGPFFDVALEPAEPPANPDALRAIAEADLIVIGPGSLFTSILPNFLVEGLAVAVEQSRARRLYVCNVANQRGETNGMDAEDHIRVLLDHGLSSAIDVAVVHHAPGAVLEGVCENGAPECVDASPEVQRRIEALGIRVIAGDLSDRRNPMRHDPSRLFETLREVL